jgi:hypothetical protein
VSIWDEPAPTFEDKQFDLILRDKINIIEYLQDARMYILDMYRNHQFREFEASVDAIRTLDVAIADVLAPTWRDGLQVRH